MRILYACVRILKACVRILYVCARILVPRTADLGFCYFVFLLLITFLDLGEPSFHVSRSRVSRITCFTCLIYALMNHMNIHENLNLY